MGDVLLLATRFGAAAGLAAVAAMLLWVRFGSPVNRWFAAVLALLATVVLAKGFLLASFVRASNEGTLAWLQVLAPSAIGLAAAVACFLMVLLWRASPLALFLRWSLAATAAGVALWGLLDPSQIAYEDGKEVAYGPLAAAANLVEPALAAAGLTLAVWLSRRGRGTGPRGKALRLVALGLAASALFDSSATAVGLLKAGLGPWTTAPEAWANVALLLRAAALPPAVVAVAWLAWREGTAWGNAFGACAMASVGTAVAGLGVLVGLGPRGLPSLLVPIAFLRVLLAAIVGYALVRHRVFGIEMKARWTISHGTVALSFLAVFLVVSQVAEVWLQSYGVLLGGVSTGLMLLALHPVQRAGERLAHRFVPRKPVAQLAPAERLRLYAEQARMVWEDGVMGRKERLLLDQLRDSLAVGFEEAAKVEHDIVVRSAGRSGRRAGAGVGSDGL